MPTYYVTATHKIEILEDGLLEIRYDTSGKHITLATKEAAIAAMREEYPGAEKYSATRKREHSRPKPLMERAPWTFASTAQYEQRGMQSKLPVAMSRRKFGHLQRMRRDQKAAQSRTAFSLRSYSTPVGLL